MSTLKNSSFEQAPGVESSAPTLSAYEYSASVLNALLEEPMERVREATEKLAERTRSAATHLKYRVQALQEERPLHFLALIAASAFAAGVTVRIWRSRSHARSWF